MSKDSPINIDLVNRFLWRCPGERSSVTNCRVGVEFANWNSTNKLLHLCSTNDARCLGYPCLTTFRLNHMLHEMVTARPHSWFPGLNLTWARTNLGSQLTYMVGLSFLLQDILGRDFNEITFHSLSSRFFSSLFLTPISSPISPIYSSKLVVGS